MTPFSVTTNATTKMTLPQRDSDLAAITVTRVSVAYKQQLCPFSFTKIDTFLPVSFLLMISLCGHVLPLIDSMHGHDNTYPVGFHFKSYCNRFLWAYSRYVY